MIYQWSGTLDLAFSRDVIKPGAEVSIIYLAFAATKCI